jgi:hypothetical protein
MLRMTEFDEDMNESIAGAGAPAMDFAPPYDMLQKKRVAAARATRILTHARFGARYVRRAHADSRMKNGQDACAMPTRRAESVSP